MSASVRGPVALDGAFVIEDVGIGDVDIALVERQGLLQGEVCRLQRELALKEKQLERKNRLAALGEMAAGVAHEIRNPLGGMGLCVDMLRKDLSDDVGCVKLLDRISGGMRTLNVLIEGMLAFASPPSLDKRECLVRDIVEKARVLVEHELRGRGTEVVNECGFIHVEMDPGAMIRAFGNIILNAAQAMGEGGVVAVRAGVEILEDRDAVFISFADTGPGLSADVAEKVFDPFFTSRDEGTGLGLSIVHSAVERHGGSVEAGTGYEGGAVFRVVLPRGN